MGGFTMEIGLGGVGLSLGHRGDLVDHLTVAGTGCHPLGNRDTTAAQSHEPVSPRVGVVDSRAWDLCVLSLW